MRRLTERARAVAGAWFGMMMPGGESHLTFQMRDAKPTAEAQAGLDELVAAGVIKVEKLRGGAVRYEPLESCWDHFIWLGKNTDNPKAKIRLMEPIAGRSALAQSEE